MLGKLVKRFYYTVLFLFIVLFSELVSPVFALAPDPGAVAITTGLGASVNAVNMLVTPKNTWTDANSMHVGRWCHTTTVLQNGMILVAGGNSGNTMIASAEIYNPNTGVWTVTGSMNSARACHTATLLNDGRVLVVGASNDAQAEIYNPTTGTWTITGSIHINRSDHAATLLSNGKVLISGGWVLGAVTNISEIYDPSTETWAITGSMHTKRSNHTMTLLQNRMILAVGGSDPCCSAAISSAEIYNPDAGVWTITGSMHTAHGWHTATLLPNGLVLVVGGLSYNNSEALVKSAELYDPSVGTWAITGLMNTARCNHTATLLVNGMVLVAGGSNESWMGTTIGSVEIYNPSNGIWTTTTSMNTWRGWHTATLLSSGAVLMTGGYSGNDLASAEIYYVATPVIQSIAIIPATAILADGLTKQFTATGTYSDDSAQDITRSATWVSSNTSVAIINSSGLLTATNPGTANITASLFGVTSQNQATLTVTAATSAILESIIVTPENSSIAQGNTRQFTATGTYHDHSTKDITAQVTWTSNDNNKVVVSSSAGIATAVTNTGSAIITATLGSITGSVSVVMTKADSWVKTHIWETASIAVAASAIVVAAIPTAIIYYKKYKKTKGRVSIHDNKQIPTPATILPPNDIYMQQQVLVPLVSE